MKKLLNILASLSLGVSATASVVACEDNKKSSIIAEDEAQKIAAKITNKKIALRARTNPATSYSATILALKEALQKANSSLTSQDLDDISFAKKVLQDNEHVNSLLLTINAKVSTANVTLNVTINATADQIKAKITDPTSTIIAIPAGYSTNLSNPATQGILKVKLVQKYHLSAYDLRALFFPDASNKVLKDNEVNNKVVLGIIDDGLLPRATIVTLTKVQIHSTVAQIKTKLDTFGRLTASFVSTDSTLTQANATKIIYALSINNPQISDWDKKQLSITPAATPLTAKTKVNVTLNITSDSLTPLDQTLTIQARRFASSTEEYNAYQIADKIGTGLLVAIPAGTNPDITNANTITALKKALAQVNPALTANNLTKIAFSKTGGNTLADNEANNTVTATITVGGSSTSVTLFKVEIHSTAAQIKTKMANPTTTVIGIAAGSNPKLTNDVTFAAFKKALQTKYSLSAWDMSVISFPDASSTTLKDNEQDNTVKLNIVDDASTPTIATVDLTKVHIHATAAQLKAKITNPTTTIIGIPAKTSTSLSEAATQTAIKNKLKSVYSLTDYDLKAITFSDPAVTLKTAEQDNVISFKITDDQATPATENFTLAKLRINRTAKEIDDLVDPIKNYALFIPSNSSTSIANTTTQNSIRKALQVEEPALTNYDLTTIQNFTVSGARALINNETRNDVNSDIIDDASPQGSASISFGRVFINSTASQFDAKVTAAGIDATTVITITATGPISSGTAAAQTAIWKAFKAKMQAGGQTLSDHDQQFFNFAKNVTITTAAKRLSVIITDDQKATEAFSFRIKTNS